MFWIPIMFGGSNVAYERVNMVNGWEKIDIHWWYMNSYSRLRCKKTDFEERLKQLTALLPLLISI